MKKTLISKNIRYLKMVEIYFLSAFMLISCLQKPAMPSGEIVNWEDVDKLHARYYSDIEARKDDIGLTVSISKPDIKLGDTTDVVISLKNRTNTDIVVFSLDAMQIYGGRNNLPYGIEVVLISIGSGERIMKESYLDLPQLLPPSPQEFSTLPAMDSQTLTFSLSDVFPAVSTGEYSIQIIYKNEDDFGAVVNTESEHYFVDYNAWIGVISSNIETFQIVP